MSLGYLRYKRKLLLSNFLGTITWVSLSTFMISSRNDLGISNIPIFEVLIFIMYLVGAKFALQYKNKLKEVLLITINIETIFLVCLFLALILAPDKIYISGIIVYSVIIANSLLNPIESEVTRYYEDYNINTKLGKKYLSIIRMRAITTLSIAGLLGSGIALLFLTYFKVNLIDFTICMLSLNVIQNMYDYHIYYKMCRI